MRLQNDRKMRENIKKDNFTKELSPQMLASL